MSDKTLDKHHSEIMGKIKENDEKIIPNIKKQLQTNIAKYNQTGEYQELFLSFDERQKLKETIINDKNKIKKLLKEKKDYLLNNSEHVHSYFEKRKEMSVGNTDVTVLDAFFFGNDKKKLEKEKEKNITKEYFNNLPSVSLDINDFIEEKNVCRICNGGELIPVNNEGIIVCNNCGSQFSCLIDTEKPSYKEPPKEVCFYAYKRINHFREILAQFQAKETTQIDDTIIDKIKLQIQKERIPLEKLTNKQTKDILKRLSLNKFYEHIPFIKDKLGIRPPVMTPELEETLCNLFVEIQQPYAKYCPDGRVNFLNYYYTIYKLCELLEEREFLPFFPMLKDQEKRLEQDEIWKKICKELDWQFIPTL